MIRRVVHTFNTNGLADYASLTSWATGEARNLRNSFTIRGGDDFGSIGSFAKGIIYYIQYWNGSAWTATGEMIKALESKVLARHETYRFQDMSGSAVGWIKGYIRTGVRLANTSGGSARWMKITELVYEGEVEELLFTGEDTLTDLDFNLATYFTGCDAFNNYVHLKASPLIRHRGNKSQGAKFHISNAGHRCFYVPASIVVEGFVFTSVGAMDSLIGNPNAGQTYIKFIGNYFAGNGVGTALDYGNTHSHYFLESNIFDNYDIAINIPWTATSLLKYWTNNTFVNNIKAIYLENSHWYLLRNNIFQKNGTDIDAAINYPGLLGRPHSGNITDKSSFHNTLNALANTPNMPLFFNGLGDYRLNGLDYAAIGDATSVENVVDANGSLSLADAGAFSYDAPDNVLQYFQFYGDGFVSGINPKVSFTEEMTRIEISKYRNNDKSILDYERILQAFKNQFGFLYIDDKQYTGFLRAVSISQVDEMLSIVFEFTEDSDNMAGAIVVSPNGFTLTGNLIDVENTNSREPIIQPIFGKNPIIIRNQTDGLITKIVRWRKRYTGRNYVRLMQYRYDRSLLEAAKNRRFTDFRVNAPLYAEQSLTGSTDCILQSIDYGELDEDGYAEITLTFLTNYGATYGY